MSKHIEGYRKMMKDVREKYNGDIWEYYRRHRIDNEEHDSQLQCDLMRARELEVNLESEFANLTAALKQKDEVIRVLREAVEFYAHVNNSKDLGSWDMRRNFIFDIIQEDDCDSAHYDIPKYRFGGKRAREALARVQEMEK